MRFQVNFLAMKQLLQGTDFGHKREDRFDHAALTPGPFLAQFHILRHPVLGAKTEITQGNRLCFVLFQQGQKDVVASVGRRPLPIHHTPVLIDDPAHFHPHDPAPIAFAFLPDLFAERPSRSG